MIATVDDRTFKGKPPKSAALILSLLKSIHNSNAPSPPGPYINGMPEAELLQFRLAYQSALGSMRAPSHKLCYPQLLIGKLTFIGAITGAMLGANTGFFMTIASAVATLIPYSIVLGLLVGGLIGIIVARHCVVGLRPDLFQVTSIAPASRCPSSKTNAA